MAMTAFDAHDALRTVLGNRDKEAFAACYLDKDSNLLGVRLLATGDGDHVGYDQRWVAQAAPEGTMGVVTAHNHPCEDATPSGADIEQTIASGYYLSTQGINLMDHYVLGRCGDFISIRHVIESVENTISLKREAA